MTSPATSYDMKILLCGFEPFGKRNINNAWEVAQRFQNSPDIDILQIPVSFNRSHKVIIDAITNKPYDLIVILGETGYTTDHVRLERLAINYKDASNPDNDGIKPDDEDVITNAPKAYFTAFPIKKIATVLKAKGDKIKVSNSTGTYVCNCVYYNILHHLSLTGVPAVALFLHLPVSNEEVSLAEMTRITKDVIEEYKRFQGV